MLPKYSLIYLYTIQTVVCVTFNETKCCIIGQNLGNKYTSIELIYRMSGSIIPERMKIGKVVAVLRLLQCFCGCESLIFNILLAAQTILPPSSTQQRREGKISDAHCQLSTMKSNEEIDRKLDVISIPAAFLPIHGSCFSVQRRKYL